MRNVKFKEVIEHHQASCHDQRNQPETEDAPGLPIDDVLFVDEAAADQERGPPHQSPEQVTSDFP